MEMPLSAVLGGSRKPRRASPRIRKGRLGREPGLPHSIGSPVWPAVYHDGVWIVQFSLASGLTLLVWPCLPRWQVAGPRPIKVP